jgi:hypothetical protein
MQSIHGLAMLLRKLPFLCSQRAVSPVIDKKRIVDNVTPAMFPSSDAEVVFFAVSAIEIFFVKMPDIIENGTFNVPAKAVPSRYIWMTPAALTAHLSSPTPNFCYSSYAPNEDRETRGDPTETSDVDLTLLDALEAGDILFIDSSHVVKAGSDCQLLFSDILPRLNLGTLIHFHDVFDRFEYPAAWLRKGRGWNEQYLLRAFLQFNSAFKIKLFT